MLRITQAGKVYLLLFKVTVKINNSKDYFEKKCTTNGFFSPKGIAFAIYSKEVWNFAKTLLKKNKVVVDLGAGGATVLYNVLKISQAKLIAIDLSKNALYKVKRSLPQARLLCEDVMATSLKNKSCDFCISTMVIEHVDDTRFLNEVYRILIPGGHFLVTTVLKTGNAWYFHKNIEGRSVLEHSHLREYTTLNSFLTLLQNAGFVVLKAKTPRIKFPLLDPLIKIIFRFTKNETWHNIPATKPIEFLRMVLRVPIPGYYAIEVIAQKQSKVSKL